MWRPKSVTEQQRLLGNSLESGWCYNNFGFEKDQLLQPAPAPPLNNDMTRRIVEKPEAARWFDPRWRQLTDTSTFCHINVDTDTFGLKRRWYVKLIFVEKRRENYPKNGSSGGGCVDAERRRSWVAGLCSRSTFQIQRTFLYWQWQAPWLDPFSMIDWRALEMPNKCPRMKPLSPLRWLTANTRST